MRPKNPDRLFKRLASPYLDAIARVAAELAQRGWAEANAGNFSIRLGDVDGFPGAVLPALHALQNKRDSALAGQALLVKAAGARMKDIARDPLRGLCLMQVNASGEGYSLLGRAAPTSELPAHLAAQSVLAQHRPSRTCVLHTHPTALAALSLASPRPKELIETLIRAHAEMELVRDRIKALPFIMPGTRALAEATGRAFHRSDAVIWPRHGIITCGDDLWQALDLVELCDKAADIVLHARPLDSSGPEPTIAV